MSDKLSVVAYNDAKRFIKKAFFIATALLVLSVILFGADKLYTEYKYSKRSAWLINQAEISVKGIQPMVFNRTSLGEVSNIYIWFINDSDRHILVDNKGDKSLFTSTESTYGGINAYRQAGNACEGLSLSVKDGLIISISCDYKDYYTPK